MSDEGEIISEADWKEAILALRNHQSLMVYCMGNEIRHPGTNPFVEHIANVTRKLDPTRLFLDTCAHGEFDREYVDFDVQHMSYFFPFGKDYDMFENTWNWLIYGSCKGYPLEDKDDPYDPSYRVTRAIPGRRPTLAHEICHYAAWRDLDALEEKFRRCGAEAPWWLAELRKLAALKRMDKDYALLREASKRFQFLGWKLGIEAARRSPLLCGFHFLQFSDTDRYENSNGVVDCFDDPSGVDAEAFLRFNGDTVLLADLPRRTFFEGEKVSARVLVSHFSPRITGEAVFSFRLETTEGQAVAQGSLGRMKMDEQGRRDLCRLDLRMPAAEKPVALRLVCKLAAESGETLVENAWNLWVYPNRPAALAAPRCTVALEGVNLGARYPQLKSVGSLEKPAKLLIANRFSKAVLDHLGRGGNVLMLYRVEETRDRKYYKRGERPARETYYLPASWDRLKGVIWDRGTNCGAVVRDNKAFDGFPNDGFLDLQFHALIDDSDKICLDDFPADVTPLMQGVDKAARDRFDVHNFKLSELQPAYTMRKFAYAFEVRVGKGRLFVTGFNFTGLERGAPETCAMFESILGYVTSHRFKPAAAMTPEALEEYLLAKGRAPRIKEREMSQYWQLNDAPLESERFWKEAQEYLREEE